MLGGVGGLGGATSSSPTLADRSAAKLRLLCATFTKDKTIILPDLEASISTILASPGRTKAESFTNLIRTTNNMNADSLDAVNRSTHY